MSGALDAVADIGLGDILSSAADLGSVVTDFGTEFVSSIDITSFEIPSFDVASLGGFDIAGSFAGDASWFDTFNPGSILDSIPSVSDFSLPSLPSLPSLASLSTNNLVSSAASSFGISPSLVSSATRLLNTPALISTASASLGINPAIVSSATRVLSGASPLSVGAQALGINPAVASAVTNGVSIPGSVASITSGGFRELTDSELAQVTRNVNPAFINSLVDPAAAATSANAVDAATGLPINTPRPVSALDAAGLSSQFTSAYDPETGQWSVFDNLTSTTVRTGLSEQDAILAEQELNFNNNIALKSSASPVAAGGVNLGSITATALGFATDPGDTTGTSARNLVAEARAQQAARNVANTQANSTDWRVRLRLAPGSTYLYNAPPNPFDPASGPGIMAPLAKTDGVIFPYTPAIDTAYKANYDAYDLTHSNYRGYFYKGSYVDALNVRAQFTAQDSNEADYLLAVIHFFRSATKMFYGNDSNRGAPPPLVYLSGYGDYQFNEHPCLISQFNYQLPADVDYIRAQSKLDVNTNLLGNRIRNPIANNPLSYSVNRILNSGLLPGALDFRPNIANNLPMGNPTYVPTKMEISITLLPTQSRQQISNNFSVKSFAAGNLLKGGYW